MTSKNESGESSAGSLIRRAQNHDRAAWERLSKVYGPVVYDWARHHGLQPDDASDVMQTVFQTLLQNIGRFSDMKGSSFRGWLWTITRNKAHDHFREIQRRAPATGGTTAHLRLTEWPDTPPEADSALGLAEHSGIHRRAVELMKKDFEPNTWQAFWRTMIDGQPANEVAEELGISRWAVYKARSRVLQRLREEFEDLI